jgi:protocatechuate 3,4-dioxygenase beta subunit
MNRRDFLVTVSAASAAMALLPATGAAQDWAYLRALERAQRERPATLTWRARIAPAGEPGTPMVIHGRLFKADGRAPAPGICVFAYHTDRTGIYADPGKGPHVWRLRGWAETDADGRFQFDSIRPAAYPRRSTPEHVHLTLEGPGVPRTSADEVFFEDDTLVTSAQRKESEAKGMFGAVRNVEIRDGVHHVTVNLRLEA